MVPYYPVQNFKKYEEEAVGSKAPEAAGPGKVA
jgi:hypothetical protein